MPTLNPHSRVRVRRRESARGRVRNSATLLALALLATMALPATVAGAATAAPVKIEISSAKRWTNTGITVTAGEVVTINASGDMHFGPKPIDHMTPNGRPPAECANQRQRVVIAFPAPTLNCWSLMGRIGRGTPFKVGTHVTFTATATGALQLGINDNRLQDNGGSWTSITSVAPAGTAPSSSGKSSTTSHSSSSSGWSHCSSSGCCSSCSPAAVGATKTNRNRPRSHPRRTDAPPEVNLAEDAAVAAVPAAVILDEPIVQPAESVGSLAKLAAPLGTSVAPVEGEVADTNIFEVEIANGTDLKVGYNYFPEETNLQWQVRQGTLFAHGQFPTNGGGNMYHYVTLPLGVKLEPGPASVDVQFTWAISGVPFRYSVRRDPGV